MAYTTIVSIDALKQHLDDPSWVIFDCRFSLKDPELGRRSYRESHIPSAFYAHLDEDLSSPVMPGTGRHPLPEVDRFAAWLGKHGVDHAAQVVAYDDVGGAFAARLWWMSRWLGHAAAAVVDGGWPVWRDAGYPVSTHVSTAVPVRFQAHADRRQWLSTAEMEEMLKTQRGVLIDARGAERFTGEEEPIDPVAGHIPGAVNLPHRDVLTDNKRFAEPELLRRHFEHAIGNKSPDSVVHMCGSGVTACHNLLAMEMAGLGGSKLYPGSWSEWITDVRRPVIQGAQ